MTQNSQHTEPYSDAVLTTLHTLIAPGRRVRISPYVEAAQAQVLFGEAPNQNDHTRSMADILERNESRIREMADAWIKFNNGGKQFSSTTYSNQFLAAYLAYYFPVNVGKLQLVLLELLKTRKLPSRLNVVDIGAGTGTTAVAVMDFLLAWATSCHLHGTACPIAELQLSVYDANANCLELTDLVIQAYLSVVKTRVEHAKSTPPLPLSVLTHAYESLQLIACDVTVFPPEIEQPSLVVVSNVLNELTSSDNLDGLFAELPKGSIVLIVEPGDCAATNKLNNWKSEWVRRNKGLIPILPCGNEFGIQQPFQCATCWNARRESLHQTNLYRQFRRHIQDKRSFDEFENYLLSWSYVVLADGLQSPNRDLDWKLCRAEGEITYVRTRFIGKFFDKRLCEPDPDVTHATAAYLKLCPAHSDKKGVDRIAVEVKPGFVPPTLQHGDVIDLEHIHEKEHRNGEGLVWIPRESTQISPIFHQPSTELNFLNTYNEQTRVAVDEIAFRLFGFSSMRDFQHKILERVLCGHSILGIAATGGGKSECFILPAMIMPGITIVISPLRALMQDQYAQRICERYGLDHLSTYINGDVPFYQRQERLRRLEEGYYKLVYLTPEQMERGYVLDSLKRANERFGIRYLALDEAHCISQWGHDFRPAYLNLVKRLNKAGIWPCRIALTATASPPVRRDLCEELNLKNISLADGGDIFVDSSNRPELNLSVKVMQDTEEKVNSIVDELKRLESRNSYADFADKGAAIVFMPWTGSSTTHFINPPNDGQPDTSCKLSPGVNGFAQYLQQELGKRVSIYHSKMDMDESEEDGETQIEHGRRDDIAGRGRRVEQNDFISGKCEIMVATKGFGMGIDKPNIRLIIHRTVTANLEAYAQEAGRAGRDGKLSTAVLYYSPDSPGNAGHSNVEQSVDTDYLIQIHFIENKYIRRQDLQVMRAFLLQPALQKIGEYLYFTNDQAIDFFDRCKASPSLAKLTVPFEWPDFQARRVYANESLQHETILNNGHVYQEKTKYIDRILQAMYRIRPDSSGKRMAFIEELQDTGIQIKGLCLNDVTQIVGSNAYFGRLIREQGLTANDLRKLLNNGDLIPLCNTLRLSPFEAQGFLQDIKKSNPTPNALLGFKGIFAPRLGPAAGKDTLEAWRNYAGAQKRANKNEARMRAYKASRAQPSTDDWFWWSELPKSKGWQVLPGNALNGDDFAQLADLFVKLHDERADQDRRNYRYLLTDYVGVSESGRLLPQPKRNCLRNVMLGYLDTGEVVDGDNCGSCSRCVENGEYETDLEKRKGIVVKLSEGISTFLSENKDSNKKLPPNTQTNRFWSDVEKQIKGGRSIAGYLAGWTNQRLNEMPGHKTALLLRNESMLKGLSALNNEEFVTNLDALTRDIRKSDAGVVLRRLVEPAAAQLDVDPRIQLAEARLYEVLGEGRKAEKLWQTLLSTPRISKWIAVQCHSGLVRLYAQDGLLPDLDARKQHLLELARNAESLNESLSSYQQFITDLTAADIAEEMIHLNDNPALSADVTLRLISLWFRQQANVEKRVAVDLAAGVTNKNWSVDAIVEFLTLIGDARVLAMQPDLAVGLCEKGLASAVATVSSIYLLETCFLIIKGSYVPTEPCLRLIGEKLASLTFEQNARLHENVLQADVDLNQISSLIAPYYAIEQINQALRWIKWFGKVESDAAQEKTLQASLIGLHNPGAVTTNHLAEELNNIVDRLFPEVNLRQQIHEAIVQRRPTNTDVLSAHIIRCLKLAPPDFSRANECINILVETTGIDWLQFAKQMIDSGASAKSPRLRKLIECISLCRRYSEEIQIGDRLGEINFKQIVAVFEPERDIDRADMAAVVVDRLRAFANPNWMTPIAYLIEMLAYAGRLDEAEVLAERYHPINIGRQRLPAEQYLSRVKAKRRSKPETAGDYAAVARALFPAVPHRRYY